MPAIFLLSPANCGGNRARIVMSERATFDLATRLRTGGAPIGEVFAFLSGLYFRGKLAYGRAFACPPDGVEIDGGGVIVITGCDRLTPSLRSMRFANSRRWTSASTIPRIVVRSNGAPGRWLRRSAIVRSCSSGASRHPSMWTSC